MVIMNKVIILLLITLIAVSGCVSEKPETTTTELDTNLDKNRGNPHPSLKFEIDCSRLSYECQDDCQTFINNQENILYPEMKRITGIDLRWCYDRIKYTIYPTFEVRAGGSASHDGNISILPEFSINSPCKMESHELQHLFDFCIEQHGPIIELMTVVGGMAQKNVCPEYEYPYNLSSLLERRIIVENNVKFEVKDCLTAWGYVIYYSDETFIHKFYEALLRKNLGEPKQAGDITEAIIYASDETDYYIKKYCLGDNERKLLK